MGAAANAEHGCERVSGRHHPLTPGGSIMSGGKEARRWWRWLPWGLMVGLVGVGATFYYGRLVRAPEPVWTIVSTSNVLDIHREVGELTIRFRGEDIQEKKLNLRIYALKLANVGNAPLRPGDLDPSDLWELEFHRCEVIDVRLADTNDEGYLQPKFTDWAMGLRRPSGAAQPPSPSVRQVELWTDVELPACLMNPGDYVLLEIVVLHPITAEPTVSAHGKVAGATLKFVDEPRRDSGSSTIVLTIVVTLVMSGIGVGVADWLVKRVIRTSERRSHEDRADRWRALVRRLRGTEPPELAEAAELVYEMCERVTEADLRFLHALLDVPEALGSVLRATEDADLGSPEVWETIGTCLLRIDVSFSRYVREPPPNARVILAALPALVRSGAISVAESGAVTVLQDFHDLVLRVYQL